MSNYVKLINNFDSLKLTTFRANIDAFIDEVNGGKADLVDALYSLTEKEMAFRQDRVNRSMVVISHFPFVKSFSWGRPAPGRPISPCPSASSAQKAGT